MSHKEISTVLAALAAVLIFLTTSLLWFRPHGAGDVAARPSSATPAATDVGREGVETRMESPSSGELARATPRPVDTAPDADADAEVHAVRGIVVDGEKRPIEGAAVVLGSAEVRTDESGRFELDVSVSRGDALVATKLGYAPFVDGRFGERPDASTDDGLFVALRSPAYSLEGRVVDGSGSGLSGWTVELIDARAVSSASGETVEARAGYAPQITGATGAFEIRGLGARSYRLRASGGLVLESGPLASGSRGFELNTTQDSIVPVVSGRVEDRAGRPVADASVRMFRKRGRQRPELTARTDANGDFRIERVPLHSLHIAVERRGYIAHGADLQSDNDNTRLEIRLARACEVELVPGDGAGVAKYALLVDRGGERLEFSFPSGSRKKPFLELENGRAGPFLVPEHAQELIVQGEGGVSTRVQLSLTPDERTVVRY